VHRVLLLAALLPLMVACTPTAPSRSAEAPVNAVDASAALRQTATLAAERTPASAELVCDTLADSCDGMSSAYRADPTSAPLSPPSIVCDIALPAIADQSGPRILVVAGRDASGHNYLGQVLVLRRHGHVVLHEPAFWNGIRYTQLVRGRAWDEAPGAVAERAAHDATVRAACTDPAAFVAAVTATTAGPTRRSG
jgi:hypothetical protein